MEHFAGGRKLSDFPANSTPENEQAAQAACHLAKANAYWAPCEYRPLVASIYARGLFFFRALEWPDFRLHINLDDALVGHFDTQRQRQSLAGFERSLQTT